MTVDRGAIYINVSTLASNFCTLQHKENKREKDVLQFTFIMTQFENILLNQREHRKKRKDEKAGLD